MSWPPGPGSRESHHGEEKPKGGASAASGLQGFERPKLDANSTPRDNSWRRKSEGNPKRHKVSPSSS